VGLLRPALDDIFHRFGEPLVVDAGSGNAYLGFVLYELFFKDAAKGSLLSIESRPELTARARERAERLGYRRMRFETASLAAAPWPERIQLVLALHACDTATDDALLAGIRHNADYIAVVPCCQAELARQLKEHPPDSPSLAALVEHPWHRREFASHLTNVIRALELEASGYAVTVTELTGWEHSLKNELLLAKKVRKEDAGARGRLERLLADTGVAPKLVRARGTGAAR
jgi:Methyltransferase domain